VPFKGEFRTLRELMALRETYCGTIGVEHI
jgi:hypothetical protein